MAELKKRITEIESSLIGMKEEYEKHRSVVRDQMAAESLKNMRVELDDGDTRLIYMARQAFVKVKDEAQFKAWCVRNGIDVEAYRTWRGADLNNFMREHLDEQAPLPDGLEGDVVFNLGVRK